MERFFHNDIYNYRTDWETFGLKTLSYLEKHPKIDKNKVQILPNGNLNKK